MVWVQTYYNSSQEKLPHTIVVGEVQEGCVLLWFVTKISGQSDLQLWSFIFKFNICFCNTV